MKSCALRLLTLQRISVKSATLLSLRGVSGSMSRSQRSRCTALSSVSGMMPTFTRALGTLGRNHATMSRIWVR